MEFRVHNASGYDNYGDDATYTFNVAGLLVVHLGRNKGKLTYSPRAWTIVEEPDNEGNYLPGKSRYSRE